MHSHSNNFLNRISIEYETTENTDASSTNTTKTNTIKIKTNGIRSNSATRCGGYRRCRYGFQDIQSVIPTRARPNRTGSEEPG